MQEYKFLLGKLECPRKVLQLEYTPDGKQIVSILKSGPIDAFRLFRLHSPDYYQVAGGSEEGNVCVWGIS